MFAKDFDKLNDLYNTRIFLRENVGLGPEAEDYEAPVRACKCGKREGEEAEECECMLDNPSSEDDIILADEPEQGIEHHDDDNEGARMVKQELFRIAKMAYMLHDIIADRDELEPWLSDKVSRAYEGLNSVFAYKDYEQFRNEIDGDITVDEKTERDLFDSINRGGDTLIQQIRKLIQRESKETVEKILVETISVLEAKKK
jgi:hypothetical protein